MLKIWIEQSIEEQLEDAKVNNQRIYDSVSNDMKEHGYDKTSGQCKIRMRTLKRNYRQRNNVMNQSGKGRITCKFYDKLDTILGTRRASQPIKIIESAKRKVQSSDSEIGEAENEGEQE